MSSDDDWDRDDFEIPSVSAKLAAVTTSIAGKANALDAKFADEDREDDDDDDSGARASRATNGAIASKKDGVKMKNSSSKSGRGNAKTSKEDDVEAREGEDELADPVAEKARRQRLVEEEDLRAARELFGSDDVKLDEFDPKSKVEYEKLGSAIAYKYLVGRSESGFYTCGLKALLRVAMRDLSAADVKEVENAIVLTRTEKVKREKADAETKKKAEAGSKKGKGKFLNAGGKGGDNGLDDFKYAVNSPDDGYDFM